MGSHGWERKPSAESPSLAGQSWEALRYVSDQRPSDGPLRTRVYANSPGPLYLTRGLLEASTETAGFHIPGSFTLALREFREGSAEANAPAPALERPLGPGAYYERRVEVGPSPGVLRVCFAAERGYLLRTEGPGDSGAAPCSDFSQAEPEPLEEVLMHLPFEALTSGGAPATAASGTRGTFNAGGPAPRGALPAALQRQRARGPRWPARVPGQHAPGSVGRVAGEPEVTPALYVVGAPQRGAHGVEPQAVTLPQKPTPLLTAAGMGGPPGQAWAPSGCTASLPARNECSFRTRGAASRLVE